MKPTPAGKTLSATTEFLFIIRNSNGAKRLSPEEIQAATIKTVFWVDELRKSGKLILGRPLEPSFMICSNGEVSLAETRPAESEERMTGFLLLRVSDKVEAEKIAKSFPAPEFGSRIEIVPVTHNSF